MKFFGKFDYFLTKRAANLKPIPKCPSDYALIERSISEAVWKLEHKTPFPPFLGFDHIMCGELIGDFNWLTFASVDNSFQS